jgi:hypothetical protein
MAEVTAIDYLNFLTIDKKTWDDLSLQEQKGFDPFMINKWLSMENTGFLCQIVSAFQKYTVSILEKKEVYNLYLEFLPKQRYYYKYIKATIEDEEKKLPEVLVNYFVRYCGVSKKEAKDYINFLYNNEKEKAIIQVLQFYGVSESEISKLVKLPE